MGFALFENLLYVYEGGLNVALVRAVLTVPAHMLFAVPMGYYLSLSRFETDGKANMHVAMSLAIPILLHGVFDFILMYSNSIGDSNPMLTVLLVVAFVVFVIAMWRYGLKKIKKHKQTDNQRMTT